MKAAIIFYPNQQKKNVKTGLIPIYLRICFQRTKTESKLFVQIHESNLSLWDPITMRIAERNSPTNHYLNRLDQKFQEFIIYRSDRPGESVSIMDIKNHVMGVQNSKTVTVTKYVDDYFINAVLNNVNRRPGTVKNYRRAINHLTAFLKARKLDYLLIDQLKIETANDFKNYLVSSDQTLDRTGMTEVSAATVIKKFRTIFSQAMDEELIKINPFKKVKIKTKSPRRERFHRKAMIVIFILRLEQKIPLQLV